MRASQKWGERAGKDAEQHDGGVERAAAEKGCGDAGEDADDQGHGVARAGEGEGVGEAVGDLALDRAVGAQRNTEVALQGAGEEGRVLQRERAVHAEAGAHGGDRLAGGFGAGHDLCGVAGEQADGAEDEERDAEQDQREREEAAGQIPPQGFSGPSGLAAAGGGDHDLAAGNHPDAADVGADGDQVLAGEQQDLGGFVLDGLLRLGVRGARAGRGR